MEKRPIRSLLTGLVILLPAFYFAWYFTGPWLAWPIAQATEWALTSWWPDTIAAVQQAGSRIQILTRVPSPGLPPDMESVASINKGFSFDAMTYSYGIPLYAALAIASTATPRQHLLRLSLGLLILVSGVFLSLLASILYVLVFNAEYQEMRVLAEWSIREDLTKYVYFLGFLIVPRVLPVLVWVVLYRDMLERIFISIRKSRSKAGAGLPSK